MQLPVFGLGGAALGELFETIEEPEALQVVDTAWRGGVRFFDTAPWYGHGLSEHRLGHFVRTQPRDAYTLSTKVGRVYTPAATASHRTGPWVGGLPFIPKFDYARDGILRSWEDSLKRLGLQRVDALVIHDLDSGYHNADVLEKHRSNLERSGWRALEELRSAGTISAIGAGINDEAMIPYFIERFELDYLLVAMPYTLLDQRVVHEIFPRCMEKGIAVVVGAPFASGILASGAVDGAVYNYAPASREILARTRRMEDIASQHGVALAAAALQFPLGHESVVSVIPGANRADQVSANLPHFHAAIPVSFWEHLKMESLIDPLAPTPS